MQATDLQPDRQASNVTRIVALDLARTAALVAMAIYHFVYDLQLFGYLPPGTATSGGWRILALGTAGSFLFLAGVSLVLAHGAGIRWPAFWRRFAMVAGAALLITIATFFALPEGFIFFGILHSIATASLLGLLVLRVPFWLLIIAAVAVLWLAAQPGMAAFDVWFWWWTGLQAVPVQAVDYVPIFPWFAPFLLGMAAAKLAALTGLWARLATWDGATLRRISWPGKHSLIIYLVHQPILIALIWLAAQVL